MPSTLVAEIMHQLERGEPFVYAYYDGIDKVAHEYGLDFFYDAELVFVDRMVEYLIETPPGRDRSGDHRRPWSGRRGRPDLPAPPRGAQPRRAAVGRRSVPLAARRCRVVRLALFEAAPPASLRHGMGGDP